MRFRTVVLPLAGLLALAGCSHRAAAPRAEITATRVGFAGVPEGVLFKPGAWTPVAVTVRAGPDGVPDSQGELPRTGFELVGESADTDDVRSAYRVPLPGLAPNEERQVTAYFRPGGTHQDLVLSVREVTVDRDGNRVAEQPAGSPVTLSPPALNLGEQLVLVLGPRMEKLALALERSNQSAAANQAAVRRVAYLDQPADLPDEWFGYAGVDVAILPTGAETGLIRKLSEKPVDKEQMRVRMIQGGPFDRTLGEWVRRGGRLVVSTGKNPARARRLIEVLGLSLPVTLGDTASVPRLEGIERWVAEGQPPPFVGAGRGTARTPIEFTKLTIPPESAAEVLASQRLGDRTWPLVVRVPHGTGQVVLVAFDLDRPPFQDAPGIKGWGGQAEFWYKLLGIPRPLGEGGEGEEATRAAPEVTEENAPIQLASSLQNRLEEFPAVPVISFGWVALLILLYIAVIGPVDYFFLKRFTRRLELTWVSLPLIVVAVVAAASYAAYSSKGHELRIRKLDLVDVDLRERTAYGQSWFTLFNPRVENYTVGLEPAFGVPRPDPVGPTPLQGPGVELTWMGRPEVGFRGYGRPRSQGLSQTGYGYAPGATGLVGVPLPVWATKSFTARWTRELAVWSVGLEARLEHDAEAPKRVKGTLTNRLGVTLEDAYIVSGGDPIRHTAWPLGSLRPDETKRFNIRAGEEGRRLSDWVPIGRARGDEPVTTEALVRRVLFYEDGGRQDRYQNESLRHLDQSWRLPERNTVVLYARCAPIEGPGASVTQSPASPTRVLLGGSPPDGTLTQETYLRFFISVRDPAGGGR